MDNGLEIISKDLDRRAYWNYSQLDFSRPGKPTDNALVEGFNSPGYHSPVEGESNSADETSAVV
jgi:transposase InsO family protein